MALFGSTRPQATPSTANGSSDALFITALTSRKIKINEICLVGNGSTSAAAAYLEYGIKTATAAAGAAGTAIAPVKLEQDNGTSSTFTNHTVTTDAAAGGGSAFVVGCNLYGGIYRWVARPNGEVICRNVAGNGAGGAGSICIRQNTALNAGTYTLHTIFDEL